MLRTVLLAGFALAISACATATAQESATAPAGADCFRNEDINGFGVVDDSTVRVRVGASHTYLLKTDWPADDISWGHVLAIRSPSGWICTGDGAGVRIVGGAPVRSYYLTAIERGPDRQPGDRLRTARN
jgi:hypothetical protein